MVVLFGGGKRKATEEEFEAEGVISKTAKEAAKLALAGVDFDAIAFKASAAAAAAMKYDLVKDVVKEAKQAFDGRMDALEARLSSMERGRSSPGNVAGA